MNTNTAVEIIPIIVGGLVTVIGAIGQMIVAVKQSGHVSQAQIAVAQSQPQSGETSPK